MQNFSCGATLLSKVDAHLGSLESFMHQIDVLLNSIGIKTIGVRYRQRPTPGITSVGVAICNSADNLIAFLGGRGPLTPVNQPVPGLRA